ncbi:MAG: DUF4432 family protein [Phycisphaerae bacterium]|nr:DUF4432 family protein [Phycisphaerae bacterium]
MNLLYPGSGAIAHDRLSIFAPHGGPMVQLENEKLRCSVLPWWGSSIVELTDKQSGVDVLCPGPGAVNNIIGQMPTMAAGQEYFNRRVGGWPELFPTGSRVDDYFGTPAPFHGESNQRRWDHAIIEEGPDVAIARFTLHCMTAPLRLQRDMILAAGSGELVLRETIWNESDLEIPFMWGHHPTYGKPLLEGGVKIELPKCRLAEGDESMLTVLPEGSKVGNMFWATDLAEGWFGVFNPRLSLGTGIRFDKDWFKFLWIWQEYGRNLKPQSFGRWYAIAVEPFTSLWQGADTTPIGPMLKIGPRESRTTEMTAFFYRKALKG